MDKISIRIPEDGYKKNGLFETVWDVYKTLSKDNELIRECGKYNDENGLYQCSWNGNGILIHTNPNKVLKKQVGNTANWTESKNVVLSIIDNLEKDAEIRVERETMAITRLDFNFDILTEEPYEKYHSFLQMANADGFERGLQSKWKNSIFFKSPHREIVCYDKYAEAQRPKYNGVRVVSPLIRFEYRNLYGGEKKHRKPFFEMTEERIGCARQDAKNQIQDIFFGLSMQENEDLQEFLAQRASGIKDNELIRRWGLKKISEMISFSGCSNESLLRRQTADGATRARDTRLIKSLDNIHIESNQAVYYNELKTKFALVA